MLHRFRNWFAQPSQDVLTVDPVDDAPGSLRLLLCDATRDVCSALSEAFRDAEDVEVPHGSIFGIRCDALVSPGNSFGDMDGGLDKLIDVEVDELEAGLEFVRRVLRGLGVARSTFINSTDASGTCSSVPVYED